MKPHPTDNTGWDRTFVLHSRNAQHKSNFVCYPRRGDSLYFHSKQCDRLCALGKGWLEIPPEEAMAYMGERFGIEPACDGEQNTYVGRRARRVAERIFPLPGRARGPLHHYFSEFFDWSETLLFKNFLRLDVRGANSASAASPRRAAWATKRNAPWKTTVRVQSNSGV